MKQLQRLVFSKIDLSEFSDGITLINSMDLEKFKQLTEICFKSENAKTALKDEFVSSFTKETKILLHLKNIFAKLIMKPKDLQDFLTEKVKLSNDKAEVFIKVWSAKPNYVLNNLKNGQHLDGVAWELYTEVAEDNTFTFPNFKGKLQLFVGDNSNTTESLSLDLNHSDMYKLYTEFEKIQHLLDNLK